MIAIIDAPGWSIIIGAVFLGLIQLATLLLSYLRESAKIKRDALAAEKVEAVRVQAAAAAVKVGEVKTVLEFTTQKTDKKLDSIHTLVNSSMGKQLAIAASLSRRIALLTGKPEDNASADEAERLLKDHEGKQAIVDSKVDAFPKS